MTTQNQKILIISVSGIGNTILQSPLINALLDQQHYTVDILFKNYAVGSVFQDDKRIHTRLVLPKGFFNTIRFIINLRKNHYDYSVACFPSNQTGFHLLAFLAGAKKRVIHSYQIAKLRTLSFLSNIKIPSADNIHDVEQNLNLLKAFDFNPEGADKTLMFATSRHNSEFAEHFMQEHNLMDKTLIGIHPGCEYSQKYRRWPQNKFIHLINSLNADGIHCLLFAGPDEINYTKEIYNILSDQSKNVLVIENNLNNVGAIIAQCHSFLSTDSGLGHIAVAKNIKTLAIFGPANKTRTAPYGARGAVITLDLECSPCMGYPFTQTHSKIRCPFQFKCLNEMGTEKVYLKIKEMTVK